MVQKILFNASRLIAAFILLQTLYFKFTGHLESVYIFETIGMEPWGRILVGVGELMASILLFIPRWSVLGGLLGMGLMIGAIVMHLTKLGIQVMGDGGYLFVLACIVFCSSAVVVFLKRNQTSSLFRKR